jgi:tRNA threonylcarbamoyladenosine biosynthesis protein TsaE
METLTASERETEEFGQKLAAGLSPHDVLYVIGDLAAGKTCLVRGVARGLGAQARQVASPTFAILHEYAGPEGECVLRHLDLYRLKDEVRELEVLGLAESPAEAPTAVEWPGEAIRSLLPPTLQVRIDVLPDGRRRIRCE